MRTSTGGAFYASLYGSNGDQPLALRIHDTYRYGSTAARLIINRLISTKFQDLGQRRKGVGRVKYAYFPRLASIGLPLLSFGLLFILSHTPVASANQTPLPSPENSQTIDLLQAGSMSSQNGPKGGGDITILDDAAIVPDAGPSGTIADILANDYQGATSVYVVHKGDTLPAIAKMFNLNLNTILWANNLTRNSAIHEGDALVILPVDGVQHLVKKGDTINSIAIKYGAKVADILDFNDIVAGQVLSVGDIIMVPNGITTQTTSALGKSSGTPVVTSLERTREKLIATFPSIPAYFKNPLPEGHKTQGIHGYNAVDLAAPLGSPVYAAADGVVAVSHFKPLTDPWFGGYGNYIDIDHPNGTQTRYAHLSEVFVPVGAHISQGQVIGEVGSTGNSTGPHLHFEIHGAKNPF